MSKIELTKEQVQRLRGSWSMPGTYHEALEKVANELVAMGLVRPATLAARSSVAGQLEPSEEEVGKVATILKNNWGYKGDGSKTCDYHDAMTDIARKILRAAARVRLEKAEGEKP